MSAVVPTWLVCSPARAQDILASSWFKDLSIILFLNKKDIFREKVPVPSRGDIRMSAMCGGRADSGGAAHRVLSRVPRACRRLCGRLPLHQGHV